MPTIKISQLSPVGSELFQDSESFLSELADEELGIIGGTADGDNPNTTPKIAIFSDSFGISLCTVTPAMYWKSNRCFYTNPPITRAKGGY
jgi:hypothetical protein